MYLHDDRGLFSEVIAEINERTGIASSIIEKDYYVTMILKLLANAAPEVVFKGGTSLSKCFHLIDRFSEDIDITFTEHIGEARDQFYYLRNTQDRNAGTGIAVRISSIPNAGAVRQQNIY